MTISLWLKPSHMGGMRYVLSRALPDLTKIDYTLMIHYEGNIELEIGQNDANSVSLLSNAIIPLEQWSHAAITLNGSIASIYINGQLDCNIDYEYRIPNQDYNLIIGANQDKTSGYNGLLDDIHIFNRALNQQQIQALAQ